MKLKRAFSFIVTLTYSLLVVNLMAISVSKAQQKEDPGACNEQSTWIQLAGVMPEFEAAGITAEYIVNRDGTMEFRIDDGYGERDGITGAKVFRFSDPKNTTDPNQIRSQSKVSSSGEIQPCMIQITANADRSCNDRKQKPICDEKKFKSRQNDQLQLRGKTPDKQGNTKSQPRANIDLDGDTFTFSLEGNRSQKDKPTNEKVPRLEVKMNDRGSLEITRVYEETKNNKTTEKQFTIEIESIQKKASKSSSNLGAQEINDNDLSDSSGVTTCGVNSSIKHDSVGVEDLRKKAKEHIKRKAKQNKEKVKDEEIEVEKIKMDALCANSFVTGVNGDDLSVKEIQKSQLVTGLVDENGGDKTSNEAAQEQNKEVLEKIAALQKAKEKAQQQSRQERPVRRRQLPSSITSP